MSVCADERLPHESSESSWRTEMFEFLRACLKIDFYSGIL